MSISRDQAWAKLCEWTATDSLRAHARAVEIVMRGAAARYGGDPAAAERWGIAGMLHDADYEKWPDEHPRHIVAWVREQGDEEMAHAISAHYSKWGVAHETLLDKGLIACDELTGFIVAACLVRPEGIETLTAQSVQKKLKDKAFARKVEREECRIGPTLLGVELGDHIQFIIDTLKPHAAELGLGGKVS